MYCEIVVYHRRPIEGATLAGRLRQANLGQELPPQTAYQRSSVYQGQDPYNSLFAHDASRRCFVILQKFNRNQSTLHVEGDPNDPGTTLLEVVEEYVTTLRQVLRARDCPRNYRVSRVVVRPFENNRKESGFEGSLFTLAQAYKDMNFWHEAGSRLVTLLTTFALIRLGLTSETARAAGLSFAIAGLFVAIELAVRGLRSRGTINWKRR